MSGGFRTILIDPPWNETGGGKIKRGADRHYPLVKTRDMPDVIRASRVFLPADDAHLWLWSTNNKLPDALWVGAELGFEYKTNAVWVKTADPMTGNVLVEAVSNTKGIGTVLDVERSLRAVLGLQIGIGQYLRGSHELLLFFTRGKGMSTDVWNGHRDVRSVIRARRTKHSAKPSAAHDLIERVSKGPRLEMFARSSRPGWIAWGDEIGE